MLQIRRMTGDDVETVYRVFDQYDIRKPLDYVTRCWEENKQGIRTTLLAFYDGAFAGSLHLLEQSGYPPFAEAGIPEINDFNVIAPLRNKGIGNALMDAAEQIALDRYGIVGIGVGLYDSYGAAQRMYVKRGYIPDGRGVMYNQQPVVPGREVRVDDDLNLYFTKKRG